MLLDVAGVGSPAVNKKTRVGPQLERHPTAPAKFFVARQRQSSVVDNRRCEHISHRRAGLCRRRDSKRINGHVKICGVAEKIFLVQELDARLAEKGKLTDGEDIAWVREMRNAGMAPHTAFGMGFERLLRWLIGVGHIKDTIPFPRLFGRHPLP